MKHEEKEKGEKGDRFIFPIIVISSKYNLPVGDQWGR